MAPAYSIELWYFSFFFRVSRSVLRRNFRQMLELVGLTNKIICEEEKFAKTKVKIHE